jgi:hypothetical protein
MKEMFIKFRKSVNLHVVELKEIKQTFFNNQCTNLFVFFRAKNLYFFLKDIFTFAW